MSCESFLFYFFQNVAIQYVLKEFWNRNIQTAFCFDGDVIGVIGCSQSLWQPRALGPTHRHLPPWSLVRFRGMVQDMGAEVDLCQACQYLTVSVLFDIDILYY